VPGALTSIFAAVNALLPTGTYHDVGADKIRAQGSWPRVIWVPGTEDFGPALGQGGDGTGTPPPIWTRMANVEIHIWGQTLDTTEALVQKVIQAIHANCWGAYQLQGGQWVGDTGASDITGAVYVLSAMFLIPVTRAPEVMASPSHMPTTVEIDFPSGAVVSQVVTTT
jgi:hypothetical protein